MSNFNAPEGAQVKPVILVMIQYYWGRGETIAEAWQKVSDVSGRTVASLKRETHLIYSAFDYIVDGDDDHEMTVKTYINDMGSTCYHRDYPPTVIVEFKAK